jgi:hypothetical protein
MGGDSSRTLVFGATFLVIAAFVASVAAVNARLLARAAFSPALSIGFAFAIVQTVASAGLFACAGASKLIKLRREKRTAAAGPALREMLAAFCVGEGGADELRAPYRRNPAAFEASALEFLRVTQGAVRARVREALSGSGLGACWRKRAGSRWAERRRRALECLGLAADPADASIFTGALRSRSRAVRIQAFRCMIALGRPEDLEAAFAASLREPLILRALVAHDLREHCLLLSQRAIPKALRDGSAQEAATALEFVAAWNRALPIAGIAELCGHADRRVRIAAFRVLALAAVSEEGRTAVLHSLAVGDDEENQAAAAAAASLHLPEAELLLLGIMRGAGYSAALAAAAAICRLGPEARDRLESELAVLGERAAAAVLEALDAFRTGRSARAGDS